MQEISICTKLMLCDALGLHFSQWWHLFKTDRSMLHVTIVIQHAIPYEKCLTGIGFNFLHGDDPKTQLSQRRPLNVL